MKDIHWETIAEFMQNRLMQNRPDFATGKIHNPTGRETYKRLWKELTLKLNSAGLGERTIEKWQKNLYITDNVVHNELFQTWTDFKCNLKKKASEI
ncbi:hypothetical protein RI129_003035 [Pyrocoelia pectoralis]|uniref:Regulatory protein zeste n=1 Tax=Pyrocoelia pectoralis TaxID=417401 RepID=A0AAN7ZUI7_9COLE